MLGRIVGRQMAAITGFARMTRSAVLTVPVAVLLPAKSAVLRGVYSRVKKFFDFVKVCARDGHLKETNIKSGSQAMTNKSWYPLQMGVHFQRTISLAWNGL